MKTNTVLVMLFLLMAGCKGPDVAEVQKQEAAPVNCATAEGDLRTLQSEKVSTAKMIEQGVTAVTPVGLVAGTATGKEKGKLQVATGEYNKMIDKKIAEIKATCGIK